VKAMIITGISLPGRGFRARSDARSIYFEIGCRALEIVTSIVWFATFCVPRLASLSRRGLADDHRFATTAVASA
jgi:hypothetical protein